MIRFNKSILFLSLFAFSSFITVESVAQTAIFSGTSTGPASSAMLDVQGSTSGVLIPRVALTASNTFAPVVGSQEESLLIYNTASTGDVTPGYYYWDGGWKRLMSGNTTPLTGTGVADKVAFWTSATDLSQNTNFHWDNTNTRLGIGNASPSVPLDVTGRITASDHISTTGGNLHTNRGRLAFSNTATDANHTIYNNHLNIDGEGAWDGMKMNVYNGLNIRVGNGGATSAVFVDEVGEVGIGTTDPVEALEIKRTGSNPVQLFHSGGVASYKLGNDGSVFKIAAMDNGYGGHSGDFAANDIQVLSLANTGNVGIGTTSPAALLHLQSTNTLDVPRGEIVLSRYWASNTDTRASSIFHYYNSTTANDNLAFAVAGGGGTYDQPDQVS